MNRNTTYEIIATLGPASTREEDWTALLNAGATQFRLNTSHLTVEETIGWLDRLERAPADSRVPVVLDLQGSKWRLGTIEAMELTDGERVELVFGDTVDDSVGDPHARRGRPNAARPNAARPSAARPSSVVLPVPHRSFFDALGRSAGEIRLNDAKVVLEAENPATGPPVSAIVRRGGPLSTAKGVAVPDSTYRREVLSEKDAAIVEAVRRSPRVRLAVSYVRDAEEMRGYRRLLGTECYLIAKLERRTALEAAASIARSCDEMWLCRGDLGAEVGLAEMARAVRRFTDETFGGAGEDVGVPVILAGQVLEHMTEHATATRSELCYLHDALQAGYAGVVLSDETAVGRAPVSACEAAAMFLRRSAAPDWRSP